MSALAADVPYPDALMAPSPIARAGARPRRARGRRGDASAFAPSRAPSGSRMRTAAADLDVVQGARDERRAAARRPPGAAHPRRWAARRPPRRRPRVREPRAERCSAAAAGLVAWREPMRARPGGIARWSRAETGGRDVGPPGRPAKPSAKSRRAAELGRAYSWKVIEACRGRSSRAPADRLGRAMTGWETFAAAPHVGNARGTSRPARALRPRRDWADISSTWSKTPRGAVVSPPSQAPRGDFTLSHVRGQSHQPRRRARSSRDGGDNARARPSDILAATASTVLSRAWCAAPTPTR